MIWPERRIGRASSEAKASSPVSGRKAKAGWPRASARFSALPTAATSPTIPSAHPQPRASDRARIEAKGCGQFEKLARADDIK